MIWCYRCTGQTNDSFVLSGSINADGGMINLYSPGGNTAFPKDFNFSPVLVRNGKFRIEGKIEAPCEVALMLRAGEQNTYLSGSFFIEPGIQTIICNVDSLRGTPNIRNATMLEYIKEYYSGEYQFLDTIKNWDKKMAAKYEYLLQYAKKHPDSYVALWEISHMSGNGYNSKFDSAFVVLSDKIKLSNPGARIQDDLNHLRLTKSGAEFPAMNAVDLQGKRQKISWGSMHSHYILVDFWFGHCSACISQFPDYERIVDNYRNKGFTMIGISIDTSVADINEWKFVIKNKSLNWYQFRVPRETADNLRIGGYPTNFLLDGSGIIIATNMDTKQVSDFLKEKLN